MLKRMAVCVWIVVVLFAAGQAQADTKSNNTAELMASFVVYKAAVMAGDCNTPTALVLKTAMQGQFSKVDPNVKIYVSESSETMAVLVFSVVVAATIQYSDDLAKQWLGLAHAIKKDTGKRGAIIVATSLDASFPTALFDSNETKPMVFGK